MPGILDRMACGFALALAIGGRAAAADPLPGGKKTVIFEDCSMCIKHRKYRQKLAWKGLAWVSKIIARNPYKHQCLSCFGLLPWKMQSLILLAFTVFYAYVFQYSVNSSVFE